MVSEKRKSLSIRRKRKNSEIVDMLKSYIKLDNEERQQVKALIEDLQKKKMQNNKTKKILK